MNVPDLPESLARWPSDPYELLGVERGVAPKDLKRNYTRLIKVFKPEHHPEHFRRIREAYEAVLRYIEIFGAYEIVAPPQETWQAPEAVEPEPKTPPEEVVDFEPAIDPPAARIVDVEEIEPIVEPQAWTFDLEPRVDPQARVVDPEPIVDPQARVVDPDAAPRPAARQQDDLASLWERAIHGEEEAAYRGLKRLHEQRPQTTVVLRLYWLLSLDPSLDPDREPCEWLIAGLCNGGLQGPCMELYRREVEAHPEEAFTDRFEKIMNLDAPTGILAEVFIWRQQAIRQTKHWSLLAADVEFAREPIGRIDEDSWLRLLLAACDGAAWIRENRNADELWGFLQDEIGQLQHLSHRHGEWFDRLEFLTAVRREWQRVRGWSSSPWDLLDLVGDAWHVPFQTYRTRLITLLGTMVDDPRTWLNSLDSIAEEGPNVLHAFAELLRQMESRLEEPTPKPDLPVMDHLTRVFMRGLNRYPSDFRHRVVAFCFREGIDPAWMVEPLVNHEIGWYSQADPQRFVQLIEDWPVRYLCQAHRLFWMSG